MRGDGRPRSSRPKCSTGAFSYLNNMAWTNSAIAEIALQNLKKSRKKRESRETDRKTRIGNFSITQGKLAGKLLVESGHADSVARHP
jgi:hypothetical protein